MFYWGKMYLKGNLMKKKIIICCCVLLVGLFCVKAFDKPTISVVMPVYNRTDLLARAIESILNQTEKDFEFIIIDDASNEKTKNVLKSYAQKDKRIHIYHNDVNKGISYSRQRGLDLAKGKYIAIMDSDDWSVPERLEKSLIFMQENPEIDAMTGGLDTIKDESVMQKYIPKEPALYTLVDTPAYFAIELMFYNRFPNVASFFKKDFVKKHKIQYDQSLVSAEDYDFFVKMVMAGGNLARIYDVLVFRRIHYFNNPSYYEKMIENSLNIRKKMVSRFFVPDEKDIKFEYNTYEKCTLLKKIILHNEQNPKIPQQHLQDRYVLNCPKDIQASYYLRDTLNYWEDFLEVGDNGQVKRVATGESGQLFKKSDNEIEVTWENGETQSFVLGKGVIWQHKPNGDILSLKHKNWSDTFYLTKKGDQGCRQSMLYECGAVKKQANGILEVDWQNWGIERFKLNKKGVYEFIIPNNVKK